jgi:periplasmic protein TonB
MLDDSRKRLAFVAITTLAVWLGLLTAFGLLLNNVPAAAPEQPPIECRLADSPVEGLAGGGGASPATTSKGPAQPAAAMKPKKTERHLTALPPARRTPDRPRPYKVESTNVSVPPHQIAVAHESALPKTPVTPPSAAVANATSSSSRSATGAAPGMGGHGAGSGSGNSSDPGSGAGTGGGFGTGGGGPRAIYAPVPSIPDDMRDEVMQASAVVRFHVDHEGKATVTLITPTEFSTLDELILETLRKWRFNPALRNGKAIDSEAEVRLLITVQ